MDSLDAKRRKMMLANSEVYSYRRIRRSIGTLGVGLPIVLLFFSFISFFQTTLQPTISHFYYTNLRELFTGILCAVGLFLVRYKGEGNPQWWKNDNLLTNISGVMAFGIALIPADPEKGREIERIPTLLPYEWEILGTLHNLCAGILFFAFAILSIFVFTIGQKTDPTIPKSMFDENNIYRLCGYAIIVLIAFIPIADALDLFPNSTFWLETLALFAFGTSWLIKGRALGQSGIIGEKLYREHNP